MRTTKPICVSLPSDLLDRLDSVAAGEERSRSQVIARLVRNSIRFGSLGSAEPPGEANASQRLAGQPQTERAA